MPERDLNTSDSPAALVAIARAARIVRDRDLERSARQELRERFGIELSFLRQKPATGATSK